MPTQLPAGFGELDFADWFRGLIAAFVGGGASAVYAGFTASLIDPKDYNIYGRKVYVLMLAMFVFNGIKDAMLFLRNRPVPELRTVKTTLETTKTSGEPTTTVRKVEETHTEPMDPVRPT